MVGVWKNGEETIIGDWKNGNPFGEMVTCGFLEDRKCT